MILDNKNAASAIKASLNQIEKLHGAGAVSILGQKSNVKVPKIKSDLIGLNEVLGGGIPEGRIMEVYGPESSGKTSLAMKIIASVQKVNSYEGAAAIVDVEHSIDFSYLKKIGVAVDKLVFSQPDSAEEALNIVDILVRCGAVKILVLDSIAALVPKSELEGDMGDSHMGLQARLMGQALRKITPAVSKTGCIVIFINQLRSKIGVMFGSPETTSGGNALKFYSSIRLDVRRIAAVKDKEDVIGHTMRVKVVKNKVGIPSKTSDFEMRYGEGICSILETIDYGVKLKVLEKAGSWYSFSGKKIAQGKENTKQFFKNNKDKYNNLYDCVQGCLDGKDVNDIMKDKKYHEDEKCHILEAIDQGIKFKILIKINGCYTFFGEKVGENKVNTKQFFQNNQEKFDELLQFIQDYIETEATDDEGEDQQYNKDK